jgi:3-oxoadipate enol-lactonase / 4-carboxymuconolactone decarboxylase
VSIPHIGAVHLGGSPRLPLLVVGPSLGTSVSALWASTAQRLTDTYHVVGWDLPGHGISPPPRQPFTVPELARAVLTLVENAGSPFTYAGVSVAGAVGLKLLLDHPEHINSATLVCTAARIGNPDDWRARAQHVRRAGTAALVDSAAQRWFAPGFIDRHPSAAGALLDCLAGTDTDGYAYTCEALARFDVRERLGDITTDVVAIAGADDIATPPESLRYISTHVANGHFIELPDTAHLAPAEQPDRIAELLTASTERISP